MKKRAIYKTHSAPCPLGESCIRGWGGRGRPATFVALTHGGGGGGGTGGDPYLQAFTIQKEPRDPR